MALGIPGFAYADLHQPSRLRDLYDLFCARVAADDPGLWQRWDAYRQAPDAVASPIERSELIVRMAPHLTRFLVALFRVDAAAAEIVAGTHRLDALFRFKIDFVRKRALPLVKGGRHLALDPADTAVVEALAAPYAHLDRELAIAAAGCALSDRLFPDRIAARPVRLFVLAPVSVSRIPACGPETSDRPVAFQDLCFGPTGV